MFYLCSFPRSGNTWVKEILLNLFDLEDIHNNPHFLNDETNPDFIGAVHQIHLVPTLHEEVCKHLMKSHGKYHVCHQQIPMIYLVRDGRDSCYSYYHYSTDFASCNDSWEAYFDRMLANRFPVNLREIYLDSWMGTWSENVESYLDRERVLIVKYEDLMADTLGQLQKMISFLHEHRYYIGQLPDISDIQLQAEIVKGQQLLAKKRQTHDRKRGSVSGWKETYTPEQNRIFQEKYGHTLARLGYEIVD